MLQVEGPLRLENPPAAASFGHAPRWKQGACAVCSPFALNPVSPLVTEA